MDVASASVRLAFVTAFALAWSTLLAPPAGAQEGTEPQRELERAEQWVARLERENRAQMRFNRWFGVTLSVAGGTVGTALGAVHEAESSAARWVSLSAAAPGLAGVLTGVLLAEERAGVWANTFGGLTLTSMAASLAVESIETERGIERQRGLFLSAAIANISATWIALAWVSRPIPTRMFRDFHSLSPAERIVRSREILLASDRMIRASALLHIVSGLSASAILGTGAALTHEPRLLLLAIPNLFSAVFSVITLASPSRLERFVRGDAPIPPGTFRF